MNIKQVYDEDRPYEKYEKYGISALTNRDLLAILLRTGTKDYNVMELATFLLKDSNKEVVKGKEGSLVHLYDCSYEELLKVKGIGKIKALQIIALLEFSKRMAKEQNHLEGQLTSPAIVSKYFMEELRHKKQEYFIVLLLDAKCRMSDYKVVSKGSLTSTIVHPREVYKVAIQHCAHSIIVLHNHPSGDPSPSNEDIQVTKRLKAVGELVGISLLDHIIIGNGTYRSLKEESYI